MYIYIFVRMCVHMCVDVYGYMLIYVYVVVCTLHANMYRLMDVCMYTDTYVCGQRYV